MPSDERTRIYKLWCEMDPSRPVVILYSRNDRLGDALLRVPALRAARTAFPEAYLIYASGWRSCVMTELAAYMSHLANDFRSEMSIMDIIREFSNFDTHIVDFRMPSRVAKTALSLLSQKVKRYEANFPGFALSRGKGLNLAFRPEHNAWRYHRLIERLAGRRLPFDHILTIPDEGRTRARQFVGGDRRPMVLMCGHGEPNKAMSPEQIAAVARNLADRDYRIVYLHTPGDGPSPENVTLLEPRVAILGPFTTGTIDDIIPALGELSAAYIGIEGGLGHLMATVMTPMVILNWGANMLRWRPLSGFVEIVEAPVESPTRLISGLPPQVILTAVDRLLKASHGRPSGTKVG